MSAARPVAERRCLRCPTRRDEEINMDTLEQRFNHMFAAGAVRTCLQVVGAWTRTGD